MPVPNTEPLQHNFILIFVHLELEQDGVTGWKTLSLLNKSDLWYFQNMDSYRYG